MEAGKSQPPRAKKSQPFGDSQLPLLASLFFSDKHTVAGVEIELS